MTTPSTTISPRALWTWNTTVGQPAVVTGYPTVSGAITKTGLSVCDLKSFLVIPIQNYGTSPPQPLTDQTITTWLRWAEDEVENDTNIRLCQTMIAAPPARSQYEAASTFIQPASGYQQLGLDYDFEEPAYDFFFPRAQDDGWMYQRLRWRPVQSVSPTTSGQIVDAVNFTGVKNVSFIYPLLNSFFQVPVPWIVEDRQHGYIRLVPQVNVGMLPLFALQLNFMGFTNGIPGGLWLQYSAGLTANDYNSNWSFIRQLVLARAAVTTLQMMQLTVNLGVQETELSQDGLKYRARYNPAGAFAGQIKMMEDQVMRLTKQARARVAGPVLGMI